MTSHYDPFGGINQYNGLSPDYMNSLFGTLLLPLSKFRRGKISKRKFYKTLRKNPIPSYLDFFKKRRTEEEYETLKKNADSYHLDKLERIRVGFERLPSEDKVKGVKNLESSLKEILMEDGHLHKLPPRISRGVREFYGDHLQELGM